MKKRRIVLAAFLICALFVVGVGYALTTQTLTVTGTASTSATDIDVYFSAASIVEQSPGGGASAGVLGADGAGVKSLTFTAAGLKEKDDIVTASYTITNDSDYPVSLAVPNITYTGNDENFFLVTTTFGESAVELDAKGGETCTYTFTVTVKLLKTPGSVTGEKCDFTVSVHATGN